MAEVVEHLTEWSLPKPDDTSSNPVMKHLKLLSICRSDENKEKEAGKNMSVFTMAEFLCKIVKN